MLVLPQRILSNILLCLLIQIENASLFICNHSLISNDFVCFFSYLCSSLHCSSSLSGGLGFSPLLFLSCYFLNTCFVSLFSCQFLKADRFIPDSIVPLSRFLDLSKTTFFCISLLLYQQLSSYWHYLH
jgi:hypothetical protein